MGILLLIYMILGYWSTGITIYANKIIIHKWGELFIQRLIFGTILGWILIPWALIKTFAGR